jgi:multidrug transporter EmrE-like cation transporter
MTFRTPPESARPAAPAPSRLLWVGLLATIAFDTLGQLLWKQAAQGLPDSNDPRVLMLAAFQQPLTWLLAVLLLGQLLLWLAVLRRSDLSFAQPLTSLSYVSVGLLSWGVLGEAWSWRASVSVLLILSGVWLISGPQAPRADARTGR